MQPDNTSGKQPRGFQTGASGNPAGRPRGSRNKTTLAVQALLDGEAENITRKAIEAAKSGDMTAIRLVMERILPARKDSPVSFDVPAMNSTDDAAKVMSALLTAIANGDITPQEAGKISNVVGTYLQAQQCFELEARMKQLEGYLP